MSTSKSESHNTVSDVITKGVLERGAQYATIGFTAGFMASLVLAAGGRGTASRKAITAFGTGVGLGSAWTRTNMDLEEALGKR
jgi:hypothetical protein|eukprot:scaffold706_cov264-Chaetoceros_neogracile.AAC.2